jgi:hypothetical protein
VEDGRGDGAALGFDCGLTRNGREAVLRTLTGGERSPLVLVGEASRCVYPYCFLGGSGVERERNAQVVLGEETTPHSVKVWLEAWGWLQRGRWRWRESEVGRDERGEEAAKNVEEG